jgi:hypothetical protein
MAKQKRTDFMDRILPEWRRNDKGPDSSRELQFLREHSRRNNADSLHDLAPKPSKIAFIAGDQVGGSPRNSAAEDWNVFGRQFSFADRGDLRDNLAFFDEPIEGFDTVCEFQNQIPPSFLDRIIVRQTIGSLEKNVQKGCHPTARQGG